MKSFSHTRLLAGLLISLVAIGHLPHPSNALLDLTKLKNAVNLFDGADNSSVKTTVSSLGPDLTRAKQYAYLIGASYCSSKDLPSWKCALCKKAKGQAFAAVLTNSSTNTQALVTINKSSKEIVVAFRGTYNVANVLQDITIIEVDPGYSGSSGGTGGKDKKSKGKGKKGKKGKSASGSGVKVHAGFLAATNSLYPSLVSKLSELLKANKGYSVVISGHSLGGSMANLAAYMLIQKTNLPSDYPTPTSYSLFTYGEPRTGNQAYADWWNSQKIQVTRAVNKGDIVPHVPTVSMGFMHHGTELWTSLFAGDKSCSKTVYEDPKCSNSLGPIYNPLDHFQYFDANVNTCTLENPIAVLENFIVPLSQ